MELVCALSSLNTQANLAFCRLVDPLRARRTPQSRTKSANHVWRLPNSFSSGNCSWNGLTNNAVLGQSQLKRVQHTSMTERYRGPQPKPAEACSAYFNDSTCIVKISWKWLMWFEVGSAEFKRLKYCWNPFSWTYFLSIHCTQHVGKFTSSYIWLQLTHL